MRKTLTCFFILFLAAASPAHADKAIDYFNLGLESNLTNTKIKYFTKALELDPEFAAAYEKRGMLYYFQEKYDKVIDDFRAYLELSTPQAQAHRMLGLGYLKTGSYKLAIHNLSRAIELKPNYAAAYADRAEAYRLIAEFDRAIRDSARALEIRGDAHSMANAYRTRAKIYRELGRVEEAVAETGAVYWLDQSVSNYSGRGRAWKTEDLKVIGLINIIGITFLFIVLKLRPPGGDD